VLSPPPPPTMRILATALCLLALAACTPREYHRAASRPLPPSADALACAAGELARLGYAIHDRDPDSGRLYARRPRPRRDGDRYPRSDWLDIEVTGAGSTRTLTISAATLEGGDSGVAPRFRAPLPQAEADRDAILDACADPRS
jgi:hypothetical protein